ncbi:hypothetical protein IMG5_195670 [Ichthyophthirius multifiliis]|uniref:Uncharacterized protein n=1 Tax=Ichthyophthirius multifiliis TaxID=5932 RepID=G0R4Z2_ICHMU|nr:hypothetical protein IMG5_195670 [Ichthyophthirius multifiliis]EGR27455.1 hypothetical protein IMG5_195670 [Ichthyophthirius multifiliis]|eukprot:XP_004024365.1 hypothetical protein IMG5_195670 [Ichthyophthirius multifiliis]
MLKYHSKSIQVLKKMNQRPSIYLLQIIIRLKTVQKGPQSLIQQKQTPQKVDLLKQKMKTTTKFHKKLTLTSLFLQLNFLKGKVQNLTEEQSKRHQVFQIQVQKCLKKMLNFLIFIYSRQFKEVHMKICEKQVFKIHLKKIQMEQQYMIQIKKTYLRIKQKFQNQQWKKYSLKKIYYILYFHHKVIQQIQCLDQYLVQIILKQNIQIIQHKIRQH